MSYDQDQVSKALVLAEKFLSKGQLSAASCALDLAGLTAISGALLRLQACEAFIAKVQEALPIIQGETK